MKNVTVVDYNVGNILSVVRALENIGATVALARQPHEIASADRLLLPGVGAFAKVVDALRQHDFVEPVIEHTRRQRPFLGICVGMQMMLDASMEFGRHDGLGLIPGKVDAIPTVGTDNRPHKVPHIGWTGLVPDGRNDWDGTLLDGLDIGANVYFVHSYSAQPENSEDRLAAAQYNGQYICAAVQRGPMCGVQFHPEKSGPVGLRILRRFVEI